MNFKKLKRLMFTIDKIYIIKAKIQLNRLTIQMLFTVLVLSLAIMACDSSNPRSNSNSLIGEWKFVDKTNITLKITKNEMALASVAGNPVSYKTLSYKWISTDSIEIEYHNWGGEMATYFITRNKVIFHSPNKVTIKGWFCGQNEVDAAIYDDITIARITE